ncbi:CHRD domain-containing protein [Sphingomonas sp.]|uniref:CHRD domain-containing protein n=1 Tax=Sphingomonas sp. TaxID=28214 RepID=UPI00286B3EC5|nr:CHRD domain-containing protein [Sphingomonas sp.]
MNARSVGFASLSTVAMSFALVGATPAAAAVTVYTAALSGGAEAPPNASPGTGSAIVTYDDVLHTLRVQVTFSGLLGTTTASHIHAATPTPFTGTAGVATETPTFGGFPLGVSSGSYDNLFNLTLLASFNAPFVTANGGTAAGAEAALAAAMNGGRSYLNIHTTRFPGGEIRGFLAPVPEPATWMMMLAGFGAAGVALRRRRRVALA